MLLQFLLEAAFLSGIGGVAGVAAALGIGLLLTLVVSGFSAVAPLWAIAAGLVASVGVGIVAGYWPALRAATARPGGGAQTRVKAEVRKAEGRSKFEGRKSELQHAIGGRPGAGRLLTSDFRPSNLLLPSAFCTSALSYRAFCLASSSSFLPAGASLHMVVSWR